MLRRILALTLKEFRNLLQDRRSRIALIVPPLIQTLVFGYAANMNIHRVRIAIYDQDRGAIARRFVARFSGSPDFSTVGYLHDGHEVRREIDDKRALAVVHLGPDFSRDLLQHRPAPVQIVLDGRNSNTAAIALARMQRITQRFDRAWARQYGQRGPPATLEVRAWFNANLNSHWFFVPGIVGLLILVATMMVTAMSVAREREQGTFDQLLVTPMRPVEILVGKSLPGFIIGLVESAAIILVAVFWFDVPFRGSLLLLYAGILLYLLAAVGVGLLLSSICATLQQALLGAFLFMVPAIILSGFATPIENMPRAIQLVTLLDPLRYFMVVVRGVFLEAAPPALLLRQFWPMAVIGLVSLTAAAWMFRRRMY
ncbi:MAG TPA: ABC transporter permease [Gammaproteobacteria bacterium]|nr:ABC transporter permease [Gammaproteobacteria bacterium]